MISAGISQDRSVFLLRNYHLPLQTIKDIECRKPGAGEQSISFILSSNYLTLHRWLSLPMMHVALSQESPDYPHRHEARLLSRLSSEIIFWQSWKLSHLSKYGLSTFQKYSYTLTTQFNTNTPLPSPQITKKQWSNPKNQHHNVDYLRPGRLSLGKRSAWSTLYATLLLWRLEKYFVFLSVFRYKICFNHVKSRKV